MIKTTTRRDRRAIPSDTLTSVRGGNRPAERAAANSLADACYSSTYSWTIAGIGTTTITVACDGVTVTSTPASGSGGQGPHIV